MIALKLLKLKLPHVDTLLKILECACKKNMFEVAEILVNLEEFKYCKIAPIVSQIIDNQNLNCDSIVIKLLQLNQNYLLIESPENIYKIIKKYVNQINFDYNDSKIFDALKNTDLNNLLNQTDLMCEQILDTNDKDLRKILIRSLLDNGDNKDNRHSKDLLKIFEACKNKECSICYEKCEDTYIFDCMHVFYLDEKCLSNFKECPMCKKQSNIKKCYLYC